MYKESQRKRYNRVPDSAMLCLVLFLCGLGCGCVCTRNSKKRYNRFQIQICCVWCCSWVGGGGGVWSRTRNPRKRYNGSPVSDVLCLVLFLGGLVCGCVPGTPGRDIIRVLFQICCISCCSLVDWCVVAFQESQEEI